MLPAFITGLVYTLLVYLLLGIAYSIFFFISIKSNLIGKHNIRSFIKHTIILHAIYLVPIACIRMFITLEQVVVALIIAIVLIISLPWVSRLNFSIKNKKE